MNKEHQKEYDTYMKEQLELLEGHFRRCMLRCLNKMHELESSESHRKAKVEEGK